MEIAKANGFTPADGYSMRKFLDDVRKDYDPLLGFQKRKDELETKSNRLTVQRLSLANIISSQPFVGDALFFLLRNGLREDEILKFAKSSAMHPEIIHSRLKKGEIQTADSVESLSSSSSSGIPSAPSSPVTPSTLDKDAYSEIQRSASSSAELCG